MNTILKKISALTIMSFILVISLVTLSHAAVTAEASPVASTHGLTVTVINRSGEPLQIGKLTSNNLSIDGAFANKTLGTSPVSYHLGIRNKSSVSQLLMPILRNGVTVASGTVSFQASSGMLSSNATSNSSILNVSESANGNTVTFTITKASE